MCALSEFTSAVFCTQYGIPQCVHCLNVPGPFFHISPDDGSFEPKRVAEVLIFNHYKYFCVIDWNKLFYSSLECNSFLKILVTLYFLIGREINHIMF